MKGDVYGIRVKPGKIEFQDTEPGNVYCISVTVLNVDSQAKNIRLYGTKSDKFKLKFTNSEAVIAPGLCVSGVIEYKADCFEVLNDRIVVAVEGKGIDVPVTVNPACPSFEVPDEVNFGTRVNSGKLLSQDFYITNIGSKEGNFRIIYSGDQPISFHPNFGTVPAWSQLQVKVEYVMRNMGNFSEDVIIELDGAPPLKKTLPIRCKVVQKHLQLLSWSTAEAITCVDFGAAYFGTDITKCAVLYNNSPEAINFVAVLDEQAEGQEIGSDMSLVNATHVPLKEHEFPGKSNPVYSIVAALPNQGVLQPYQKCPLILRFSPRWSNHSKGFASKRSTPRRKDYALFMNFVIVGSKNNFKLTAAERRGDGSCEVALTGTALGVSLELSGDLFEFGGCARGDQVDALCYIRNRSSSLPIKYELPKIAQFSCRPSKGQLAPGVEQEIVLSFCPQQYGEFQRKQPLLVYGNVAATNDPLSMGTTVIERLTIKMSGHCDSVIVKPSVVFNTGITPKITHEVGMNLDQDLDRQSLTRRPPMAVLKAEKTRKHRHANNNDPSIRIAYPNDRFGSIRPFPRDEQYKTIFTGVLRHNYIDPDYTLANKDVMSKLRSKRRYMAYIEHLRRTRKSKSDIEEYKRFFNSIDIGIDPWTGIKSPSVRLSEAKSFPQPGPLPPNVQWRALTMSELQRKQESSSAKPMDGLNAIPTTPQEIADCSQLLTPQQLHQLCIGPATVDFGDVCAKSAKTKYLDIINNLDRFVHVQVDVDCAELRHSSPLSQVVPPNAKALVPLIFESSTFGSFSRSADYVVNSVHRNHIMILANVVPVHLDLSVNSLVIEPMSGLSADLGIRGTVRLINKRNMAAQFQWSPVLKDGVTAFSIRPAYGLVEAYQELELEVVFHASYLAPDKGQFICQVKGGNKMTLDCKAKIGPSNVHLLERRVNFGDVPIMFTTTRSAILHNDGPNHAYFQVLDAEPFAGMQVEPLFGIIPVGGDVKLDISYFPTSTIKFDGIVRIAIRAGKTIELRIGGTVVPPSVDMSAETIDFGCVPIGSSSLRSVRLSNKGKTKARVEFNLAETQDFELIVPANKLTPEDVSYNEVNKGMYSITLDALEQTTLQLKFTPTEVASYNFLLQAAINQLLAPTPSPTPLPPTPAPSIRRIGPTPLPTHFTTPTPRRRVVATALRQPIRLSDTQIRFTVESGFKERTAGAVTTFRQKLTLTSQTEKPVKWTLDLKNVNSVVEKGIFCFLRSDMVPFLTLSGGVVGGELLSAGDQYELIVVFSPDKPGLYEADVRFLVEVENYEPIRIPLALYGHFIEPSITFDPLALVFTPVPLSTPITMNCSVVCRNYVRSDRLVVDLPHIDVDQVCPYLPFDGNTLEDPAGSDCFEHPLSVVFESGDIITPQKRPTTNDGTSGVVDDEIVLQMAVTFCSPRPMSFQACVTIIDSFGTRYELPVTCTADNSLLTCYSFIAKNLDTYRIVCLQGRLIRGYQPTWSAGSTEFGEAMLVPVSEPSRISRPSTSATESKFEPSLASYESSKSLSVDSAAQPIVEEVVAGSPNKDRLRSGAVNRQVQGFSQSSARAPNERTSLKIRSLGSSLFPNDDSEEGYFHEEVAWNVQRWFSQFGWPQGPYPFNLPLHLRTGCGKTVSNMEKAGALFVRRTVYEMIAHLYGRAVPGIPLDSPLPLDPVDRVHQLIWQHNTLLVFLKAQGGTVASIKPEYLLHIDDFKQWRKLQPSNSTNTSLHLFSDKTARTQEDEAAENELFESLSKRAWTDVLLQLLKCLVISKVTAESLVKLPRPANCPPYPKCSPDPSSSNVYSVAERVLLTWMNHLYEKFRTQIWALKNDNSSSCPHDSQSEHKEIPTARWVVNFDLDLVDSLVLGAVVGAHLPFLIPDYLSRMYTRPNTAEQCLHNALILLNALSAVGLEYDIQAIELTDPNPIAMLLFCYQLYVRLPLYVTKGVVEFDGCLHQTVTRQVKLQNPSSRKPVVYHVSIFGPDKRDFRTPIGTNVKMAPKASDKLTVEFCSRRMGEERAVLLLIGRKQGNAVGRTLVFQLVGHTNNYHYSGKASITSHCYELKATDLTVTNPYNEEATFKIHLREEMLPEQADSFATLKSFFCAQPSVHLEAHSTSEVTVHFLPFSLSSRRCILTFDNTEAGQFLYLVEGKPRAPLPNPIGLSEGQKTVRVSSAAAASMGRGLYGGNKRSVYWQCTQHEYINQKLPIPVANPAKQHSLLCAAHQMMSADEKARRQLTDTLNSTQLAARVVETLSFADKPVTQQDSRGVRFDVTVDNAFFTTPDHLYIPVNASTGAPSSTIETVELPVSFSAEEIGHHICQIRLFGPDDVRCYQIEAIVTPPGLDAAIEFSAPVHQPYVSLSDIEPMLVTQNIPIVNATIYDWNLVVARIEGEGFFGPRSLIVKANESSYYPLMFKPKYERRIDGKLVLINEADGTEHTFKLVGNGLQALPLDTLRLSVDTLKTLSHTVTLPNLTHKKLTFRAGSNLDFLSGIELQTVLPMQSTQYTFTLKPLRRGFYRGVISFTAVKSPKVYDSDGEEMCSAGEEESPEEADALLGYRVWYAIELEVLPPPPQDTLSIVCHCLQKATLEITLRNPLDEPISLEIQLLDSDEVFGADSLEIAANEKSIYRVFFAPNAVRDSQAQVVLFAPNLGEFWYQLQLKAVAPRKTVLPEMRCELGQFIKQTIELRNNTREQLELSAFVSNENNFWLELDAVAQPLVLVAGEVVRIPLRFTPSDLGFANHFTQVVFQCQQLDEWVFEVQGEGIVPSLQPAVAICTEVDSFLTFTVTFQNPMDYALEADVYLLDASTKLVSGPKELSATDVRQHGNLDAPPFRILLKKPSGIQIGARQAMDVLISFQPNDVQEYHTLDGTVSPSRQLGSVVLDETAIDTEAVEKGHENGVIRFEHGSKDSGSGTWEDMKEMLWMYPVRGVVEVGGQGRFASHVMRCEARQRLDDILEFSLIGASPSGVIIPAGDNPAESSSDSGQILFGDAKLSAPEYTYSLAFSSGTEASGGESEHSLASVLALRLLHKARDQHNDCVKLAFSVVFSPNRPMCHDVELVVKGVAGGSWRFPLRFEATEPPPDDTLVIESAGLKRESSVSFRLFSHLRHPVPFSAFLTPDSDDDFTVEPTAGELMPLDTEGTVFTVSFSPQIYGRQYRAKLIVLASEMQWSYDIVGKLPQYRAPTNVRAAIESRAASLDLNRRRPRNFIRDNLHLNTTGASSRLKGRPLIIKPNIWSSA